MNLFYETTMSHTKNNFEKACMVNKENETFQRTLAEAWNFVLEDRCVDGIDYIFDISNPKTFRKTLNMLDDDELIVETTNMFISGKKFVSGNMSICTNNKAKNGFAPVDFDKLIQALLDNYEEIFSLMLKYPTEFYNFDFWRFCFTVEDL